jgi:hypothetical protein
MPTLTGMISVFLIGKRLHDALVQLVGIAQIPQNFGLTRIQNKFREIHG